MITLEHTGACLIMMRGKRLLPGDTIEVDELSDGIKSFIAEGRLTISNDTKKQKQIVDEVVGAKKKKEPKTISEAEKGLEYK
uniref:Uncharacterized protein n=1 Tax=Escherichia phage ETEP102 TaxID=3117680 RepID=A0AAU6PXK1_9CAUD